MGILDTLIKAQGGDLLNRIGGQVGLDPARAQQAAEALVPALSKGLRRNAENSGGLDALLGAIRNGGHERYLEDARAFDRKETVQDGNGILGHIFGSKDVSRAVASQAASNTGIDAGILKKMLPMLAAAAMGALGKQSGASGPLDGLLGGQSKQGGGGLLTSFLDADGDGSIADDLLGMAGKFFGR
ncbi:MAG: DUF937 domain-containing protein [Chromatiales bacterium]|nr:DUF937 domain-containing protein [Chromatiales bacterium]